MASRPEGDKLPYEWYWTSAMVHLGPSLYEYLTATKTVAVILKFTYDHILTNALIVQCRRHEMLLFLILASFYSLSLRFTPSVVET